MFNLKSFAVIFISLYGFIVWDIIFSTYTDKIWNYKLYSCIYSGESNVLKWSERYDSNLNLEFNGQRPKGYDNDKIT